MLRRGGDRCGGTGAERAATACEEDVVPPAGLRPGRGAATDAGTGAFLVIRRAVVEAEESMGSPDIEARAPRLGKSAGGALEVSEAEGMCVLCPGRTNWRTGACGAVRGGKSQGALYVEHGEKTNTD